MNDDREMVISQLDQMQANQEQLRDDREEMRRRLEQFESESGLIRQEVNEKDSEIDELRDQLSKMTQNMTNYQNLTEQCNQLKDDLENVRDLYRDAQDEITHLSQFKQDRAALEEQLDRNRGLTDRCDQLEQESRDMEYEISQNRDLIEHLKSDKIKSENDIVHLNDQLIKSQVRQQEQQNTITELFKTIQTGKTELEHTQHHSRDSESRLVTAQTERLKELSAVKAEAENLRDQKGEMNREISHLKRRIEDLEHQLEESVKNHEISSMGEELMLRFQRELDQQEELDEKLLTHLSHDHQDRGKLGGRLQELLDKVHDEGLNVLTLSEHHLMKGDSDSERMRDHENLSRRLESQLEQEKIINRDLQDALLREQNRIHEQERRAESDRETIEKLQTQVAQAR